MRSVILIFASLLLTGVNALVVQSPLLGVLTLVAWLAATSGPFGAWASEQANGLAQRAIGTAVIMANISLFGSFLYYTLPVNALGLLGVLFIISTVSAALSAKYQVHPLGSLPHVSWRDITLFAIGSVGILAWWFALEPVAITEAVRSPWLVVSPSVLLSLAVCACAAALLAIHKQHTLAILLIAAIIGSIVALTAILYPLGYGFDPFLHRATVNHILEYGTITPKPLYYIGQYALELTATSLFALPLFAVDVALVPLALALAVLAIMTTSKHTSARWVSFLLLPFAAFLPTTPQALAYVFALLTIFALHEQSVSRQAAWIFALATTITHPLAGIPVLLFVVIEFLVKQKYSAAHITAIILTVLGGFALPAVFLLQASMSDLNIAWASNPFDVTRLALDGFFANKFNTWMDALYLIGANTLVITIALAAASIRPLRERSTAERASLLVIVALVLNFLALNQLFDFNFLISYERSDFALRLLTLIALFALPLAGTTIARIFARLENKPVPLVILPALLTALVIAAQTYVAYPRHDSYTRSAGFNVSATDIDAVHAIAKDAGDAPYVVLANQAVSAAAVDAFGFAHYFPGDIFYYPIPTGGPLYNIFLSMVDESPSREHALEAMELTQADTVYLVVNVYWWRSDRIIAAAKEQADDWFALNDGAVTIFKFTKTP